MEKSVILRRSDEIERNIAEFICWRFSDAVKNSHYVQICTVLVTKIRPRAKLTAVLHSKSPHTTAG